MLTQKHPKGNEWRNANGTGETEKTTSCVHESYGLTDDEHLS